MTPYIFVYITTRDMTEAETIGRMLVEKQFASCANIIPGMQTIYRWEGKIESGSETILIVKALATQFNRIAAEVRELHSYKCPCIVALPISAGTPDFLAWLGQSTQPASLLKDE